MRRIKRAFWFLLALIFLIEAWLWDLVQPLVQRIVAVLPLERARRLIERLVDRLPHWATLFVIALPDVVLVPTKLFGLWLSAKGQVVAGMTLFIVAKALGIVLTVFLFELCRPKLMELQWFAAVYGWFVAARAWARAQTEPARRILAAWKLRILGERSVFLRKLVALRKKLQRPS